VVKAKRVYEAPAASDGRRVLVMRLWPRGISRSKVDLWLKDLGADVGNLRAWKAGKLDWPEMRRRYLDGLSEPPAKAALAELRSLARAGTVTLLCSCADEAECHRGILKSLLARSTRRAGARPRARRAARRP